MQLTIDCQVDVLDLDKLDAEDGALIQLELLRRTGQRTVPNGMYGTLTIVFGVFSPFLGI